MSFQSVNSNCDAAAGSERSLIHERSACEALAAVNMEEWSSTSAVTSRRSFLFIYFYLHTLYCVPKLNTLCRSVYRDIWDFHFLVATQETLRPASISVTCERQLIRTRSVGIMAGTTRRIWIKHEAIGSGMNQARTFPHELVIDCQHSDEEKQ